MMLNNKILSAAAMFLFAVFANTNLSAQNSVNLNNDEINSLADRLSKKVLLNETQLKSVKSILVEYSKELEVLKNKSENATLDDNKKKQLITITDKKITDLLDEKQKMKYEIVKKDWWKEVRIEEND